MTNTVTQQTIMVSFPWVEAEAVGHEIYAMLAANNMPKGLMALEGIARTLLMRRYQDWLDATDDSLHVCPTYGASVFRLKTDNLFEEANCELYEPMTVTLRFPEWAEDLALLFKLTFGGAA